MADIHENLRIEEIHYNGHQFRIHPDCRLYFTTKLPNPILPATIYSKLLVINFNTTKSTLEQQLLTRIIESEENDNEHRRQTLITANNENKLMLEKLEENLLLSIAATTEIILDSVELISLLECTKSEIGELLEKIDVATIAANEIDAARQTYAIVARKGAQLYFVLNAMATINHMYQYSLDSFLRVFGEVLCSDDMASHSVDERIASIIERLCLWVYQFGVAGLFEEDRLLFAFEITTKMALCDGLLHQNQIDFFVRGVDYPAAMPSDDLSGDTVEWLPSTSWQCIQILETEFNDKFHGLAEHILMNANEWRKWYDRLMPDNEQLPGDFQTKLNEFEVR